MTGGIVGRIAAAFAQVSLVYYGAAVLLHYIVPRVIFVKSIQPGERNKDQVLTESLNSIGEWTSLLLQLVHKKFLSPDYTAKLI
jgi:hypothetical protein